MSFGKIILVFTFLAALQLVQCEYSPQEDNFENVGPAQNPESKIGQNYRRQPRQNDDEDNEDSDSDSTTKRTAPLIPVLANILKQAIGGENTTLTNVTNQFQSLTKLVFRPITNPIRGFTNFLGLTKPEAPAPAPVAAEKSANDNSKQAVPPVFPSKLVKIKNEKAEVEQTVDGNQNRQPRHQF